MLQFKKISWTSVLFHDLLLSPLSHCVCARLTTHNSLQQSVT